MASKSRAPARKGKSAKVRNKEQERIARIERELEEELAKLLAATKRARTISARDYAFVINAGINDGL